MPFIRIVSTPPGFAPLEIRAEWVDVHIPLVSSEEAVQAASGMDPTSESAGGYIVRGEDAVLALRKMGRDKAADFWESPTPPAHLRFKREVCEVVNG